MISLRLRAPDVLEPVMDGRWSGLRRAAGIAWFVASWLAVIVVGLALVGAIVLVTVPRVLGWQGVVVLSGSMEPALQTGGIAFVAPVDPADIERGDIITFRRAAFADNLITHRVVEVNPTTGGRLFVTKGDANEQVDSVPVSESELVGRVRFDLPYIGSVVDALQDQTNYFIFIGIPAFLLILNELWTIGSEYRKWRRGRPGPSAPSEGTSL